MSIQRYKNFDKINTYVENEGKRIQDKDLFILSKEEKEEADFGDCKNDVLEVTVYDINNNLLQQKAGNNVAYIKMPDIKTYVYNITNRNGIRELAIDVEKLLNDCGFFVGIYKINLNFVKTKVGSDNQLERVWIQEISPSRQELRILPYETSDETINTQTKYQFEHILNLSKNFSYYKTAIINYFSKTEAELEIIIRNFIEATYGKEYFSLLKRDFGISAFDDLSRRIYEDFKTSVNYYLTNRYYHIGETNYGKQETKMRFESCENYNFNKIIEEIKDILFDCIIHDTTFIKKRNVNVKRTSKEFGITTLRKDIKDNLDTFKVEKHKKRNVYNPKKVDVKYNETTGNVEYDYNPRHDEEHIEDETVQIMPMYPPEDGTTTEQIPPEDLMPIDPIPPSEEDNDQPNIEKIRTETGNIVLKDGSQINRWGQEDFTPPGWERRAWPKEEDRPDNRQMNEGKPSRILGEETQKDPNQSPTQKELQSDLSKILEKIAFFEEKAQTSNMNLNTGTLKK